MTDFARLPDRTLHFVLEQLERKVRALRLSQTAVGALLLAEYSEKLAQVRAEQERRRGI